MASWVLVGELATFFTELGVTGPAPGRRRSSGGGAGNGLMGAARHREIAPARRVAERRHVAGRSDAMTRLTRAGPASEDDDAEQHHDELLANA